MGQQYKNQSRYCDLQNQFTAYLQIAVNRKKRDYIQKQLRHKTREFPIGFQTNEVAGGSDPGLNEKGKGLSQLENIALARALSGLTARERFILFERVLNDRGYDELGRVLGLGYNGAASAYHRIIKKLRKELRGEGR